jgi:hypothetical protein
MRVAVADCCFILKLSPIAVAGSRSSPLWLVLYWSLLPTKSIIVVDPTPGTPPIFCGVALGSVGSISLAYC